jgi:hypothetical protein
VSREVYLSYIVGHLGECVQVGERLVPEYDKFLPIFRNVRVSWYWPFRRMYGPEFPGEISMLEVYAPTPANLRSVKPRRVHHVDRKESIAQIRARRYVPAREAPAPEVPAYRYPDPFQHEEAGWSDSKPQAWQSGGGGDFGGGGASGGDSSEKWEAAPSRVESLASMADDAVQSTANYGTPDTSSSAFSSSPAPSPSYDSGSSSSSSSDSSSSSSSSSSGD